MQILSIYKSKTYFKKGSYAEEKTCSKKQNLDGRYLHLRRGYLTSTTLILIWKKGRLLVRYGEKGYMVVVFGLLLYFNGERLLDAERTADS